jgi:lipopolysaccharide assembly outer membrane protein LptD (OstA)
MYMQRKIVLILLILAAILISSQDAFACKKNRERRNKRKAKIEQVMSDSTTKTLSTNNDSTSSHTTTNQNSIENFDTTSNTNNITTHPADTAVIKNSDTTSITPPATDPLGSLHRSKDITSPMTYSAKDSVTVELKKGITHLYNTAKINYQKFKIESDYMEVNLKESEIFALPTTDSNGDPRGIPHFEDGDNIYDAKELRYNIKSSKGLIRGIITEQNDLFVHGVLVKKLEDDVTYIKNASFTSCDAEHPHFDIRSFKAKIVPQKAVFMGLSMMFIEDIPTPLVIPFLALPDMEKVQSGLIFPRFGQTARSGYFMQGLGFYWKVNQYFDWMADGDLYTAGDWTVRSKFRYTYRYHFYGTLNFGYSQVFSGERGQPERDHRNGFSIQWTHNKAREANPNSNFSANVNFSNSTFSRNSGTIDQYLQNTTNSNITYSLRFAQKLNLAINAGADYNTSTRHMNITLPNLVFSVDQLYPFRRKFQKGRLRWWENISFKYGLNAENRLSTIDTAFFQKETWSNNLHNGIRQNINISSTVKVLKHINWTNSLTYNEFWYTQNIDQYEGDSAKIITQRNKGFKTTRDFSFSSNFSFKLYGVFRFKKGYIKAFRHVLTPNVGFTYRPDFSKPFWGAYGTYKRSDGQTVLYSHYQIPYNIYGGPSAGMVGSINFNLGNTFDMKVRSKKDTVSGEKNVKLLENFNIRTSYNIAADSLRWTPLTLIVRTVLFQKLNVDVGASFDWYKIDSNGRRYNEFFWVGSKGKNWLRFASSSFDLSLSWNLNPKAKTGQSVTSLPLHSYASPLFENSDLYLSPIDFNVPWNLSISMLFSYQLTPKNLNQLANGTNLGNVGTGSIYNHSITSTLTLSGNVTITPKWKVVFGTGFDLVSRKMTHTNITFSRDLHCWDMSFFWIPFGQRAEWNFRIAIRSSVFSAIKYEKHAEDRY